MCNIAKNSLIFYVLIPMLWLKFLVLLRSVVDTKGNDFPHEYTQKKAGSIFLLSGKNNFVSRARPP